MHITLFTDAMAVEPLARVPGLRKENSTLTPVRLPLRATGVSYTRTTVPVRVSALRGRKSQRKPPGVRALAIFQGEGDGEFQIHAVHHLGHRGTGGDKVPPHGR